MPATILAIETAVPKTSITQEGYRDFVCNLMQLNPTQSKFLQRITANCQISKRHSVVKDFASSEGESPFFQGDGTYPSSKERNDRYKEEAPKLAEEACEKALIAWGGERKMITHIVSVSCTGMMAPGIEFLLVKRLGLSPTVERLGINFMGCFGAFKGLAVAKALALENPKHRVLMVCTELCSLHFQGDLAADTMISNALFADGSAAVIVGRDPQPKERPLFELHHQASQAIESTEELMSWEAGNFGYEMRLSSKVPHFLEHSIYPFVERLTNAQLSYEKLAWAVHPGGAAILESIVKALAIAPHQIEASWRTLKNYGNMSSATFLFVLKEQLKNPSQMEWVVGLGFGPGLSIEGTLMKRMA